MPPKSASRMRRGGALATEDRPVRAVLFDVGGPIDTEVERERYIDAAIMGAVAAAGFDGSAGAYADANDEAVASFAPDAYAAIIFTLTNRDLAAAEEVYCSFRAALGTTPGIDLRPGIKELLAALASHNIALGLAANQPASAL